MKRILFCALAFAATLLMGFAYAGQIAEPAQVVAKPECKKKVKGKCAKPKAKSAPKAKKKKPKPFAPVKPTIEKGYRPPFLTTSPRTQFAVAAYKQCMYDDSNPDTDRIERVLALNLVYRNEKNVSGSAEKIGREVCLADALGLKRYETQGEIDHAKGTELFEVSDRFIEFPDDEGNRLPPERRFARLWAKEYVEALARDLHAHLLSKRRDGNVARVPLLRVNSLVRSLADQAKQHSPAKCKNEICSTHLTGSTVDIANGDARVSEEARQWIRARLLKDRKDGKILMIQEVTRPHYHIFVIPPEFVPSTIE